MTDIDFAIRTIADCACARAKDMPPQKYGVRSDPFEVAIKALQEKKDRENNASLTLDELRNDAESGECGLHIWIEEISSGDVVAAVTDITEDGVVGIWCACTDDVYRECDYGKTWLAYRHKKEETE